jgi:hypothetical protein
MVVCIPGLCCSWQCVPISGNPQRKQAVRRSSLAVLDTRMGRQSGGQRIRGSKQRKALSGIDAPISSLCLPKTYLTGSCIPYSSRLRSYLPLAIALCLGVGGVSLSVVLCRPLRLSQFLIYTAAAYIAAQALFRDWRSVNFYLRLVEFK